MAKWSEIKKEIQSNYTVVDESSGLLKLIFEFPYGRSQLVFIEKANNDDGELWIQVSSPVGMLGSNDLELALELLGEKLCGGLIKEDETYVVRNSMLMEELSYEELFRSLKMISVIADELEEKFIRDDEY
ncbi:MAG: hypothetical protein ACTTKL_05025 [Treponema sp.]